MSPSRTPETGPGTWDPPPAWWRTRLGITAIVVAFALLGTGIWWLNRPAGTTCAAGVAKRGPDHSCVGLTDGEYAFTPDLGPLFGMIRTENQRVQAAAAKPGGAPWVSVVYLMSMVPGQGGTTTGDSVRHELEGAYTAQWEANHTHAYGDSPQIRLLLAHTEGGEEQRDYTLGQISARKAAEHIVAVAGLGTSTLATRATIQQLTKQDIAAFGSVITSDELHGIPGLVRVAPPNTDEAAAAAKYLTHDHPNAKVLLVQDRRSDDLYSRSLGDSFRNSYPASLMVPDAMDYDSSKSDVSTYFTVQMANLCDSGPDVVFFAGRGIDLPRFLAPLAQRECASKPLTVISGDDVSQVEQSAGVGEVKSALKQGNIRLIYTALAHPGAWKKRPESFAAPAIAPFLPKDPATNQPVGQFVSAFPRETLDDGQAIMGYDATLTAVFAIRTAASGPTGADSVTGQDVMQMLTSLYGKRAVPGASGSISLDPSGDPQDKAIPIVELGSDGSVTTVAVSSRTGNPPDEHAKGG